MLEDILRLLKDTGPLNEAQIDALKSYMKDSYFSIWDWGDVEEVWFQKFADELPFVFPTEDYFRKTLQTCMDNHDASIGINWDVFYYQLESCLIEIYPDIKSKISVDGEPFKDLIFTVGSAPDLIKQVKKISGEFSLVFEDLDLHYSSYSNLWYFTNKEEPDQLHNCYMNNRIDLENLLNNRILKYLNSKK
jgi:hypothetical protein